MALSEKLSRFIALGGSIFTLAQIFLLASDKEGFCFNEGCEVVDSLTTVPPIVINVGGFIFFQLVFWGYWLARQNRERLHFVRVVLLAGLAAEGVLVSFQYYIAQTFCSYCLVILGLIVALNLLAGLRHILAGAAVFVAVSLSFASLQFGGGGGNTLAELDRGSFAYLAGEEKEKRYLFFSSTCKYCERVIESLGEETNCAIRFNPIDEIQSFALESATRSEAYDTAINRQTLQNFGLRSIPVLLVTQENSFQVITGAGAIEQHLAKVCSSVPENVDTVQGQSGFSAAPGLEFLPPGDEACAVDVDCDDPLIPQPGQ